MCKFVMFSQMRERERESLRGGETPHLKHSNNRSTSSMLLADIFSFFPNECFLPSFFFFFFFLFLSAFCLLSEGGNWTF